MILFLRVTVFLRESSSAFSICLPSSGLPLLFTQSMLLSCVIIPWSRSKDFTYCWLIYCHWLPHVCRTYLIFSPAFFNLYGYDQYFCWFASENPTVDFWLKMGFFFIPLWVLFFFNLICSQITYRTLKRLELEPRQLTIFKRLMLFPFIMLITGFFATVDTIYFYLNSHYLAWLDFIGIILLSFYGCFTAIVIFWKI